MRGKGTGDQLARGAIRASYVATEVKVSDETWAKAFDSFDYGSFMEKKEPEPENDEKE